MDNFEVCIIELLGQKKNILIASVYRAPNSDDKNFFENFKKMVQLLNKEQSTEIIVGLDHNYDLLKSNVHHATQDFTELLLDNDLWPIITKPTCITKSSATLIDNILVTPNIYGSYQCGILLEDLSDHLLCVLVANNMKVKKKDPVVITSRKLTPKNILKMKQELMSLNMIEELKSKNANESFDLFHSHLIGVIDKIAPYKSFTPKKYL